jgi:hypothetical protein
MDEPTPRDRVPYTRSYRVPYTRSYRSSERLLLAFSAADLGPSGPRVSARPRLAIGKTQDEGPEPRQSETDGQLKQESGVTLVLIGFSGFIVVTAPIIIVPRVAWRLWPGLDGLDSRFTWKGSRRRHILVPSLDALLLPVLYSTRSGSSRGFGIQRSRESISRFTSCSNRRTKPSLGRGSSSSESSLIRTCSASNP